jgi:formamidopyrimidine-DNA glycosylase
VPELPEVETIRRQLGPDLEGRRIAEAWAFPSAKFDEAPAAVGATVGPLGRRGKYLLAPLDRDGRPHELVVHLGMTGRLAIDRRELVASDGSEPHLRAAWRLDDGRRLTFVDVRRFGRIAVVASGDHDRLPTLAALGPEPFDDAFTPDALRDAVNRSRRHVKTHLLSQRVVAGVGNIYADEALWRAGVHPCSRRLTRADADRLRDAVRDVLAEGIDDGGTTLRDYRDALGGEGAHQHALDCYGRAGEPCPRCGTTLRRCVVDARTTTFCPACQTR